MSYKVQNGKLVKIAKNQSSQIIQFGAYYHDKDDDGVSICFSKMSDPKPGFTEFLYNQMLECKNEALKEIRNGSLTTAEVWDQLRHAIRWFNYKNFGTDQRPSGRNIYQTDVIKCMNEIVVIVSDIWTLTELGEIQNDNYNGMMFTYSDSNKLSGLTAVV